MVTTFSPPAKPKKKEPPYATIILGVVAAIGLVAAGLFFAQSSKQTARANLLSDNAVKIATAVGVTNITPEVLADATASPAALDELAATVAQRTTDAQKSQSDLEAARADLTRVQAEAEEGQQSAADVKAKFDTASRDLATSAAALDTLQKKYDADVAQLQSEIESLKSGSAQLGVVGEDVVSDGMESAATDEAAVETDDGDAEVTVAATGIAPTGKVSIPSTRSKMFTSMQYNSANSNLVFIGTNGKKLTHHNVPELTYISLNEAPVFDVFYRFKFMDVYESTPKDREFVRDLFR